MTGGRYNSRAVWDFKDFTEPPPMRECEECLEEFPYEVGNHGHRSNWDRHRQVCYVPAKRHRERIEEETRVFDAKVRILVDEGGFTDRQVTAIMKVLEDV